VDHDPTRDHDKYESIVPDCSKLQKGDLIFFYNTDGSPEISHVGIYVGDCKMIHAGAPEPIDPTFDDWTNLQTHKVQIVTLTSDIRKKYYIGAKRLCPDASSPAASASTASTPASIPSASPAASTPVQSISSSASSQSASRSFLQYSCSEVKGCCSWDSSTKCAKSASRSGCAYKSGSVFTAFDGQCTKYPGCTVTPLLPTNNLIAYAKQYIGCPYSGPATGLWTPAECKNGLTCATYVSSVYSNICGITIYGHGADKCYNSYVTMVGSSPENLLPGDIFSYGIVDASNGKYGHTGMYTGLRGTVSSSGDSYTLDDSGDYIFIHSTWPKVSYTTYTWVMSHAPVRFCRTKTCPKDPNNLII
jgi:cell wall-associated NlpC family hydrolase